MQWVRFFDNKLWIIFTYADGTFTTTIEAEELTDMKEPAMYLDRQIKFPECNATRKRAITSPPRSTRPDNKTTFELPYEMRGHTDAIVRYDETKNKGLILGNASSGKKIVCDIKGDWTKTKIMFGAHTHSSLTMSSTGLISQARIRPDSESSASYQAGCRYLPGALLTTRAALIR